MKIAVGQTIGTPADVAANLQLMERLAVDAARQGADLLVLPELFLTGYGVGDAVQALAEPHDGPSAAIAARIASTTSLGIVYGYPERCSEGIYDSAAVFDRTGRLVANYRKVHLWGAYECAQFIAGQSLEIFDFEGLRLGLLICYDLDFPEMARALSLAGADGAIALSAITTPYAVVPRHLVPTRAYENRMFVALANLVGQEGDLYYAGESCVAAPDGEILASCGQSQGLAVAALQPERYAAYRREHGYVLDRRPELYQALPGAAHVGSPHES